MKLLILLKHRFELWTPPDWFAERLRTEFPGMEVVHLRDYDRADEELGDTEILITWSLRGDQFLLAKKLKWIHSTAAAVHALISPELQASNVVLTNARSVHAPVVAEHVIALMFALAKRLPSAIAHQQQKQWSQTQLWHEHPRPRELAGSTLAMIGYGAIGREVTSRASALGMKVLAVRKHASPNDADCVEQHTPNDLNNVLHRADFVVLAPPLTPDTTGMIGPAQFSAMKRDAYLINVGRGPLIHETALLRALHSRQIGGAALDVFDQEPLPPESPLWSTPNLLITPHSAGLTDKMWHRHFELFTANLRRYLNHQPLEGIVDLNAGY